MGRNPVRRVRPVLRAGSSAVHAGVAEALCDALGLDGHGRLLDAGCGPGRATLLLSHLFDEVVGLDPDRGMIAEAERRAAELHIANARFVRERAEALPAGLGSFLVVTFAASFHWMDRPRVAAAVRTMLEPDGAAVQIDPPGYGPSNEVVSEVRVRYLGDDRRAGRTIRNTSPDGEDDVFRARGLPARRRGDRARWPGDPTSG